MNDWRRVDWIFQESLLLFFGCVLTGVKENSVS